MTAWATCSPVEGYNSSVAHRLEPSKGDSGVGHRGSIRGLCPASDHLRISFLSLAKHGMKWDTTFHTVRCGLLVETQTQTNPQDFTYLSVFRLWLKNFVVNSPLLGSQESPLLRALSSAHIHAAGSEGAANVTSARVRSRASDSKDCGKHRSGESDTERVNPDQSTAATAPIGVWYDAPRRRGVVAAHAPTAYARLPHAPPPVCH